MSGDGVFEAAEESFSNQQNEIRAWKEAWNELKSHVVAWNKPSRSGIPSGVPLDMVLRKISDLEKKHGLK